MTPSRLQADSSAYDTCIQACHSKTQQTVVQDEQGATHIAFCDVKHMNQKVARLHTHTTCQVVDALSARHLQYYCRCEQMA